MFDINKSLNKMLGKDIIDNPKCENCGSKKTVLDMMYQDGKNNYVCKKCGMSTVI